MEYFVICLLGVAVLAAYYHGKEVGRREALRTHEGHKPA